MKQLATFAGVLVLASLSAASHADSELYRAVRSIKDMGISLKPWAAGAIAEASETSLEGGRSIRITSRNYFQGGTMNFSKPTDLSKDFDNDKLMLRISIKIPEYKAPAPAAPILPGQGGPPIPGGTTGGGAGNAGGDDGGLLSSVPFSGLGRVGALGRFIFQKGGGGGGGGRGPGGEGRNPGGNPGGAPGTGAQPPVGASVFSQLPPIEFMRLVVTTTDNKKSEIYVPLSGARPSKDGWRTVGFPLKAISGFNKTNKTVSQIAFSTNTLSTFYIGEVKATEDTTPLSGDIYLRGKGSFIKEAQINIGLNDQVEFRGVGTGGASIVEYSWDFDASNGIQVDAKGASVKRSFRKAGTFTITLTIRDKYGLKTSANETMVITVNP